MLALVAVPACGDDAGGSDAAADAGDSAAVAAEQADDPGAAPSELADAATLIVANSPGTLTTSGTQRVLVALLGDGPNQFLGNDEEPAELEFLPPDSSAPEEAEGRWLSPETSDLGLYVVRFEFDRPGAWQVDLAGTSATAAAFEVVSTSTVPGPGDPAPRSATPTADSVDDLATITTDTAPVDRFYQLSIADAVANGRPTVVAFATPAFCQTALCGPTLDVVKAVAAGRSDIDFIHVEPFDIDRARAGSLEPVDVMFDWGLATEPWVFVVDGEGVVTASFEGIIGADELTAAIDSL
jgi:hypothetical protein